MCKHQYLLSIDCRKGYKVENNNFIYLQNLTIHFARKRQNTYPEIVQSLAFQESKTGSK